VRELRRTIPPVHEGFARLDRSALGAGALDARTKELIALAIAVVQECDGCVVAHAGGAVRTGATSPEVAEAIGVAVLMSGGTSAHGPRAFAVFQELVESGDAASSPTV
jgi:AhpD family alkylhydroperoxidase